MGTGVLMKLTSTRRTTAQVIEDETTIHTHAMLPPALRPPCAILVPGDPYVSDGMVFTKALITYELRLVAPQTQQPETVLDQLEQMAETVFEHLGDDYRLALGGISEPYSLVIGGATSFPAVSIGVTVEIDR
jgi:hypothetical protein